MTLWALALYVVYILLLEKEKMHRFKRFYLLAGLVFAMLVPLLTFEIDVSKIPANLELFFAEPLEGTVLNEENRHLSSETTMQPMPRLNYSLLIWMLYISITSFFLFRLVRNYLQILQQVRKNEKKDYRNVQLVLIERKVAPHSFGSSIFINREDYYSGLVSDEIFIHEWTHVRQRHSYDLLFIELLISMCWFNPAFYLYRNKIKLNHEFLADEAVIGNNKAIIPGYFDTLMSQISQSKCTIFTSNFNFIITKKRIMMMTSMVQYLSADSHIYCSRFCLFD
jgi:beta-lactamase regulating signal transducer with metallopeptidase domain